MENKLLSFSEFESLYESYGFVNEAETVEKPEFTPTKTDVSIDDLLAIFSEEPANEAGETPSPFTPIKKGEKSDRVKELQKTLGLKGVDGAFGDATEKAVKEFQTANKLTTDGKVGVQTLTKMLELKGEKDPAAVIKTKYIIKSIKTVADAKKAGLAGANEEILKLYDITVINNGVKVYVICMPKADAAAKIKALDGKGKLTGALAWMKLGLNAIGKALCLTAEGAVLITADTAKAMISSVASAAKFITGGAAYVMGASVQGIAIIGKWVAAKSAAIYNKATNLANELWKSFATGFAKVAKASVTGLTAFLKGAESVSKTVGYTLTGIAVTAWKGIASVFTPAIKTLVESAKDGAAFITGGMAWIAKNVKDGAIAFKNTVVEGWNATKNASANAYNSAKKALSSSGKAIQDAAKSAYDTTTSFFSSMYAEGKKAWESEIAQLGLPIFESQELEWDVIDFSAE